MPLAEACQKPLEGPLNSKTQKTRSARKSLASLSMPRRPQWIKALFLRRDGTRYSPPSESNASGRLLQCGALVSSVSLSGRYFCGDRTFRLQSDAIAAGYVPRLHELQESNNMPC